MYRIYQYKKYIFCSKSICRYDVFLCKKTLNGDVATILLSGCRGYIDKIWENSNLSKVLKNGLSCDPGLVFANHLGIFLIMSDQ